MTIRSVLKPLDKVYWVSDQDCTLVVQGSNGGIYKLKGLEQVLWDCLVLGYSRKKIIRLLMRMNIVDAGSVEQTVASIMNDWQQKKLLMVEAVPDG